jgi:hypothetical protein
VASVPHELLQPFATRLDALQPAELPPISLPDPAAVAAAESAAARAEAALVMRDRCGPYSSGLCASVSCGLLGHTVRCRASQPNGLGSPICTMFYLCCYLTPHHCWGCRYPPRGRLLLLDPQHTDAGQPAVERLILEEVLQDLLAAFGHCRHAVCVLMCHSVCVSMCHSVCVCVSVCVFCHSLLTPCATTPPTLLPSPPSLCSMLQCCITHTISPPHTHTHLCLCICPHTPLTANAGWS